jgi:hypothetical protein
VPDLRISAPILALILGVLGVASATAETLNARFEIYTGGFKALAIETRAAMEEGTYGIEASLKTTGVIDWILRFSQTVEGKGQRGPTTSPLLYLSDGTFFGTRRMSRLDYKADGDVAATLDPANEDDDRTPVPETMKRDTIDPMSVFAAFNRVAGENASPCSGKVPVFDGRRRFNLVFEDDGVGAVEKSQYTVFSGPALRCKVQMERLAGFQRNPRFNSQAPRISILYVARFGEGAWWLPVRLESESSFGNVVGHLVEVSAPVRPLGRGPRPGT